jgi:hypothetical protein
LISRHRRPLLFSITTPHIISSWFACSATTRDSDFGPHSIHHRHRRRRIIVLWATATIEFIIYQQ